MADLEPTIALEELGKVETVKVYSQTYIDRQEKRIKELEKELEQVKKVQIVEHFEAYGQCRDSRRIAGLEAENEELKARVEKQNADILTLKILTERQRLKIDTLKGYMPWKDIKDKSEIIGRLTKAKEIIEKLLNAFASNDFFEEEELNTMSEAEQFLKEVEE